MKLTVPVVVAFLVLSCGPLSAAEPHITCEPKAAAGKFAMALDVPRGQVCYFSHSGIFLRFGLDGELRERTMLLQRGEKSYLQFPLLQLDNRGVLHAAWTTLGSESKLYRT